MGIKGLERKLERRKIVEGKKFLQIDEERREKRREVNKREE